MSLPFGDKVHISGTDASGGVDDQWRSSDFRSVSNCHSAESEGSKCTHKGGKSTNLYNLIKFDKK